MFDADKQTISLYHNGIFAGEPGRRPDHPSGNDDALFRSLADDDNRRLFGDLDDFVVYNRALTPPEISNSRARAAARRRRRRESDQRAFGRA